MAGMRRAVQILRRDRGRGTARGTHPPWPLPRSWSRPRSRPALVLVFVLVVSTRERPRPRRADTCRQGTPSSLSQRARTVLRGLFAVAGASHKPSAALLLYGARAAALGRRASDEAGTGNTISHRPDSRTPRSAGRGATPGPVARTRNARRVCPCPRARARREMCADLGGSRRSRAGFRVGA